MSTPPPPVLISTERDIVSTSDHDTVNGGAGINNVTLYGNWDIYNGNDKYRDAHRISAWIQ